MLEWAGQWPLSAWFECRFQYDGLEPYDYNPERARELLENGHDGEEITIYRCLTATWTCRAEAVQQELRVAGINVRTQATDAGG